jgi:demethylmenaquinone methyltransferase/2-methoxy-6-polyprenyl-1,4-benzoquinol methylase
MFDRIVERYDLLNRVLSFGLDAGWRRMAAASLLARAGSLVLDVATGTGDLALAILDREPEAYVHGIDPSARMLVEARRKMVLAGFDERVYLQRGDARVLPYPDHLFDGVAIAFGIRNVPDLDSALAEFARVTRPGGRVAVLELCEPGEGLLARGARLHVHYVVPLLGSLLSGSREYRYLQESIAAFPRPEQFAERMRRAGLDVLDVRPLTFGVSCLFVATPSARGRRRGFLGGTHRP